MTKQEALKLAFKYAKPKIEKGIIILWMIF